MTNPKEVAEENLSKALEKLQDLAKGHASGSTATTKVESMRDAGAGAGSGAGATQVHHTPSNSDPGSWAGSSARDVGEDGAHDGVDANGTDYKGGAKMMKSILEKIAKGLPLNADEAAAYAAIAKGDFKFGKEEDDKDEDKKVSKSNDEDEDDKDMDKSLAKAHSELNKGFEMSNFLKSWAAVQDNAQRTAEQNIRKSIANLSERQAEYNTELAKSISALAEVLAIQAQRIEQVESTPARGFKSQVSAQVVEKSFGAGGPPAPAGEELHKSQILSTMEDMVVKGKLSATEVVKFESTSQLTPQLEEAVRAHRTGR